METLSEEKEVVRQGKTVSRPAKPWSKNCQHFLAHLWGKGLPVPYPLGIEDGQEKAEFLEGEQVHPYRWSDEGLYGVGKLVSRLHRAAEDFSPLPGSGYAPWYLRELGGQNRIWCHGDIAPWNMLTKNGLPLALIDWEFSGPLDPLTELARVCWLFPQLVDDDLGKLYALPDAKGRSAQVRLICDAYGLGKSERKGFFQRILEVAICETAHEAIDPGLGFEAQGPLWGFAWRSRSLYWIWRNRDTILHALD